MVRTRTRIYSTYILLLDNSLLFHDRFISRRSLVGKITDSIIVSKKCIYIDTAYDEMISELLDKFSIRDWKPYLLKCINDEMIDAKYSAVINTNVDPRELIVSTKRYLLRSIQQKWLRITLAGSCTIMDCLVMNTTRHYTPLNFQIQELCSWFVPLMSMIENSTMYLAIDINGVMGSSDTDQIMKLIDICRFQHDWWNLSLLW